MPFVEPLFLWGALAVVIPVIIHFWHQKHGKPLPWAATQWLVEKQQQQSRGLQLDNILLLIIRCLLLILLAILLAQPLLNWFSKSPEVKKIHLVQPSSAVADNFKFELTEAVKKGEKVVWADEHLEKMEGKSYNFPNAPELGPLRLQTAINQLDVQHNELHLYIGNNQALAEVPAISVPARFQLHSISDSTSQPRAYLLLKDGKKLFINRTGKLTSSPSLEPSLKFQSEPTHSGPIRTLLSYRNAHEKQTVAAALAALTDVYGLDLVIDDKQSPNQVYDWVLSDQVPAKSSPQTLFIVSGNVQPTAFSNLILTNETLTPQTSERVENGQLPEWLGEQLLQHYNVIVTTQPLTHSDLKTLFIPSTKPTTEQHASLQNALLLLFIVLVLLERWLALTKNA
ncbi:BatA domain-containing protein [Spirosoma litoris]